MLVFYGYLLAVAQVAIFPFVVDTYFIDEMRAHNTVLSGINLVPLATLDVGQSGGEQTAKQIILNVVLGVPFGLLVPFVGVTSAREVILLGVLFALGIEAIQLVIDLVYQFGYRTVDVNDVLLNVIGVSIGIALFHALQWTYRIMGLSTGDVGDYLDSVLAPRRARG